MQKTECRTMFTIRAISQHLLYKLGRAVSGATAKKLARLGFNYESLRNLANSKGKDEFMLALKQRKLSKPTQQKLADHFYL